MDGIYGASVKRLLAVVLSACVLSCSAFGQLFNCYEGQGVLENLWADWSWCTRDLANTTYVMPGSASSIQVTYTGGYQALSFASNTSFPAKYFTSLNLTINGGAATGRSIQVALIANGNTTNSVDLNKYVQGGVVAANTWSNVSIPLSVFGVKPTDEISRFWLQESSGQAQPPYYLSFVGWTPAAPPSSVEIGIKPNTSLRTVDQKMFGVNTAMWDSGLASKTCKNLVAKAGFKSLRFPGGSLSDQYHWATNKTDYVNANWPTNFDTFASMAVAAAGGQCFITANYGTGTAAEAAAWVKYSNITKHYGFKYWEVGNECFGSWEVDNHARPQDPVIYANQFALYSKQMKAVDPNIRVGAVAIPGEDTDPNYPDEVVTNPRTGLTHSGWTAVMLATLAKLKSTPDFIIYHRYPEYVNECDFTLFLGNSGWYADMADLRQQLKDYLGSANTRVEIMCTENNCDAGKEGKQMCSLVNGVFMADTFGTILQTECVSFLWWDLLNGKTFDGDQGSWLYGWRPYGDEGVMSTDFVDTYPVYYMEQMFNRFTAAGDKVVATSSTYDLVSAFATKRADGSIRVMVVNKNPTAQISGRFTFTGFAPAGYATRYSYGMKQDNAAMNGQPQIIDVATIKNAANKMSQVFPPYSVTVLVFTNR